MLLYLSLGIACAAYAASWGEPPETCTERLRDLSDTSNSDDIDDICDSVALNIANSLQAVSFQLRYVIDSAYSSLWRLPFAIKT